MLNCVVTAENCDERVNIFLPCTTVMGQLTIVIGDRNLDHCDQTVGHNLDEKHNYSFGTEDHCGNTLFVL